MGQQSSKKTADSGTQKYTPRVELSPRLCELEKIAGKMYKGLEKEANTSDLNQNVDTVAAEGWARAAQILTNAALFLSATKEQEQEMSH